MHRFWVLPSALSFWSNTLEISLLAAACSVPWTSHTSLACNASLSRNRREPLDPKPMCPAYVLMSRSVTNPHNSPSSSYTTLFPTTSSPSVSSSSLHLYSQPNTALDSPSDRTCLDFIGQPLLRGLVYLLFVGDAPPSDKTNAIDRNIFKLSSRMHIRDLEFQGLENVKLMQGYHFRVSPFQDIDPIDDEGGKLKASFCLGFESILIRANLEYRVLVTMKQRIVLRINPIQFCMVLDLLPEQGSRASSSGTQNGDRENSSSKRLVSTTKRPEEVQRLAHISQLEIVEWTGYSLAGSSTITRVIGLLRRISRVDQLIRLSVQIALRQALEARQEEFDREYFAALFNN